MSTALVRRKNKQNRRPSPREQFLQLYVPTWYQHPRLLRIHLPYTDNQGL